MGYWTQTLISWWVSLVIAFLWTWNSYFRTSPDWEWSHFFFLEQEAWLLFPSYPQVALFQGCSYCLTLWEQLVTLSIVYPRPSWNSWAIHMVSMPSILTAFSDAPEVCPGWESRLKMQGGRASRLACTSSLGDLPSIALPSQLLSCCWNDMNNRNYIVVSF